MVWLLPSSISGSGRLGILTMQTKDDCENAATVCNTGAEINKRWGMLAVCVFIPI